MAAHVTPLASGVLARVPESPSLVKAGLAGSHLRLVQPGPCGLGTQALESAGGPLWPELLAARATLAGERSPFAEVEPGRLARDVVARVRDRAELKSVDVVLYCTCGPIWVQPSRFAEALVALIASAVEATRRGHPVVVDVRETREGDALWQIQDSGEGLAGDAMTHQSAPVPRLRTGLPLHRAAALALAWATIELHEGQLQFESAPGVGTTASVWLPGRR